MGHGSMINQLGKWNYSPEAKNLWGKLFSIRALEESVRETGLWLWLTESVCLYTWIGRDILHLNTDSVTKIPNRWWCFGKVGVASDSRTESWLNELMEGGLIYLLRPQRTEASYSSLPLSQISTYCLFGFSPFINPIKFSGLLAETWTGVLWNWFLILLLLQGFLSVIYTYKYNPWLDSESDFEWVWSSLLPPNFSHFPGTISVSVSSICSVSNSLFSWKQSVFFWGK